MVVGIVTLILAICAFFLARASYKAGFGIAFAWLIIIGVYMALAGAAQIDTMLEASCVERKV